jgi:hypothetical protein
MALIDEESSSSRVTSSDSSEADSPLSGPNDSGYMSEKEDYSPKDEVSSRLVDAIPASNAVLREALQRQWISFIADDRSETFDLQVEAPITVYGKDRRAIVESLSSGSEWIQQEERLKLLAADWKGATAALKEVTGAARR